MKAILALGLLSLLPMQPTKYDLLWKPKVGQKLVYAVKVSGTYANDPFEFSTDVHMAVKKVEPNGNYIIGNTYRNLTVNMFGIKEKFTDDPEESMRFDARGNSLDPEEPSTDDQWDSFAEIIARAGEVEKPVKPVAVGETWTKEFAEDKKLALPKSKGTYKLLSADAGKLRVSMIYAETAGANPTTIRGIITIRESDGAPISADSEIGDIRLMPGSYPTKLKLTLRLK
jgi:hypothetical protein